MKKILGVNSTRKNNDIQNNIEYSILLGTAQLNNDNELNKNKIIKILYNFFWEWEEVNKDIKRVKYLPFMKEI